MTDRGGAGLETARSTLTGCGLGRRTNRSPGLRLVESAKQGLYVDKGRDRASEECVAATESGVLPELE